MIEFRPIRLEDREVIERYTMPSGITNCDLSFANMYCWQFMYHSAWAEIGGFLVIRFHICGGNEIGYMQPVGEGDFTPILPLLAEDASRHGQRLRLIGLTDDGRERIRRARPDQYAFRSDPAQEDYIYDRRDLSELPGRKYQSKRNHINRFVDASPDYRYQPLTREHFAACMELERRWRKGHEGHDSELSAEQRAMQRAFDHFDELGMYGGALFSGAQMAAFTYGSAVNATTFDTHAEKADTAYEGAYTMINKLFAEHLPSQFTHVNREEDLGIEGLRRAKLSYHPVTVQHKYLSIFLRPDEVACKQLWRACFGDGDEFIDWFLINWYSRERMLSTEYDERMTAMLHQIPCESELGPITYIYGVATDPDFRNRGLASELVREALRLAEARGDKAVILIPSSEALREFYGRLGFAGTIPVEFRTGDSFDFGSGDPTADRAMIVRFGNGELPGELPGKLTCTPKQ